jgi:diguanylate cyclase (GGDEF)-like protein
MAALGQSARSWRELPIAARLFVGAVCAVGGGIIAACVPAIRADGRILLAVFVALAVPASLIKVGFARSASTLTLCQVLEYVMLLLLGPRAAVLVAAVGAWTQCTFRSRHRNPVHQTLFSVCSLACAVETAGILYIAFGGRPGVFEPSTAMAPFAAAATMFYVVNSGLVAVAIALSSEQPLVRVWSETSLWSWPAYALGAGVAAAGVVGVQNGGFWVVPFLAIALALTFYNLQAYRDRFTDSITDPLTGVPNLRFVLLHATREMARAVRSQTSLALVLTDLDGFKWINDTYGHATGDTALRRVARCLQASMRSSDVCARYGGDEFLIVLPNCGVAEAQRRAHELQEAVGAIPVGGAAESDVFLSISVGTAVLPNDGESLEQLLEMADARMYRNKSAPRLSLVSRGREGSQALPS